MMRLSDIAVRIEGTLPPADTPADAPVDTPSRSGGLGGGVAAILAELAARLELLAAHGDTALIDLRSLPMSPADRIELQDALGQGEVRAMLDAQGESTLYETAYAGVWWIVHRDREGKVTSELLEVTLAPRLLAADAQDLAPAAAALRLRIVAPGTARSAAADTTPPAATHIAPPAAGGA
jgi:hydrogenase-1 operon protein HyaF